MKVAIVNLHGIKDGDKAYYRKLGLCYDFVSDKTISGTELTEAEAINVLNHKDYYLKMYGAEKMVIES